eukprot:CAMPEP_0201566434 /NCGR_PEP_ID=MMETSP0190_2-20130828/6176_1 /ASSEMBLY_ACC=CAM_ASM_000263 /TAXON_ID=37353 /ORGANISM="Rosalina sp." /LENGTH=477 /DNA_ID=CAMNT_0047985113 /DNA_START=50 /DNA_END=1484 /DNA_ORIENTATION=-
MSFQQKHWPIGSGGCTREVKKNANGAYQLKGSSGFKDGDGAMQQAINDAIANGSRYAVYTYNGSQYYVEVDPNGKDNSIGNNGDDSKSASDSDSDSDFSDVDDLLNNTAPGLSFVGDGSGQKVDIPFNSQQSVVSLKQDFADKMQCDSDEIQLMAWVDGNIVEVERQTLEENKVTNPKDLIICKKTDRQEAVKRIIRAKKWDDKDFRKQAKSWMKESGNEGKQGIDNLIKKNGLADGWNDVLAKLEYTDVLKIIRDPDIMATMDKIRVDASVRSQYNISDDQIAALTYSEIAKMAKKDNALREQFYEDMSKTALSGTTMEINPDCAAMFAQFEPGKMGFYGVISLVDGKDLKAMGVPCKNVDQIKKGQVFVYPSSPHNKDIKLRDKTVNGGWTNGSGTGHSQVCDLSGLPPMFCAGFGIQPPTLKFRSGTCNSSKRGTVKGFDNGKAINKVLQDCLKTAFTNTKAKEFYNQVDDKAY